MNEEEGSILSPGTRHNLLKLGMNKRRILNKRRSTSTSSSSSSSSAATSSNSRVVVVRPVVCQSHVNSQLCYCDKNDHSIHIPPPSDKRGTRWRSG
jgi:hypothetical protein